MLKPRAGKTAGQKLELTLSMSGHVGMKTVYVYEWMKASDAAKVEPPAPYEKPEEPESEVTESDPEYTPPRELNLEVPKDEDGNYIDSGHRFSNLHGEVMIRRGDDPIGWEFAQLDMVIYEGDRIRTSHDSGVEITMDDLTTFKMKPESEIIINTYEKPENKLKMLAGKVWANVKQMVTEGTLDVEMSQAVAGIKGTTFVVEETGSESVLKVINGKVELETNTGDRLVLTGGAMATVKEGSPAEVKPFSVDNEVASWNLEGRNWRGPEGPGTSGKNTGERIFITTEGDLYPLFTEDFNDSSLDGWETEHGTWGVKKGVLTQTSNYWSGG
ncbi:MAG: FecR domain-containing protein, partial [Candidatus Bipolaricaulia bacterium]